MNVCTLDEVDYRVQTDANANANATVLYCTVLYDGVMVMMYCTGCLKMLCTRTIEYGCASISLLSVLVECVEYADEKARRERYLEFDWICRRLPQH
jgi:hypothetical protein